MRASGVCSCGGHSAARLGGSAFGAACPSRGSRRSLVWMNVRAVTGSHRTEEQQLTAEGETTAACSTAERIERGQAARTAAAAERRELDHLHEQNVKVVHRRAPYSCWRKR